MSHPVFTSVIPLAQILSPMMSFKIRSERQCSKVNVTLWKIVSFMRRHKLCWAENWRRGFHSVARTEVWCRLKKKILHHWACFRPITASVVRLTASIRTGALGHAECVSLPYPYGCSNLWNKFRSPWNHSLQSPVEASKIGHKILGMYSLAIYVARFDSPGF